MSSDGRSGARGAVTNLAQGAIHGWLPADLAGAVVEAVLEEDVVAARAIAVAARDGTVAFTLDLPPHLMGGRMRFVDVRLAGGAPLDGSPVLYDAGLLSASEAAVTLEGVAGLVAPATVVGWARAADRRVLEIEVLRGDEVIASAVADRRHEAAPAGDACGFEIDLSALPLAGETELVVRVVGQAEPLPGGVVRLAPVDGPPAAVRSYLTSEDQLLIARLPLEHLAVSTETVEQRIDRFVRRLEHERYRHRGARERAGVLLLLPGQGPPEAAELSARVWALQSHPGAGAALREPNAETIAAAAAGAGFVTFAWPGDLLHPSLLAALSQMDGEADAVAWDRFVADHFRAGSPGWRWRRRAFDAPTLRQGAMTDTAFAVRGERLARAPAVVLAALAGGDVHPLLFWLAGQDVVWARHPESLTASLSRPDSRRPGSAAACEALLVAEGSQAVVLPPAAGSPAPFLLSPARRPRTISIVLMGAARAEAADRSFRAIAGQLVSADLQLVLIDDKPIPETVLETARDLFGVGSVRLADAGRRQPGRGWGEFINVAVAEADGQVVVLCDAGVTFEDPLVVEQLALWALEANVGAVGCSMRGADGRLAHGLRAAAGSDLFAPPFEAEHDSACAGHVRVAPAAPVRLAAMARETLRALGGLDGSTYPDRLAWDDLMLRASVAGLVHLHLGHLTAVGEAADSADGGGLSAVLRARRQLARPAGRRALGRDRVAQADPGLDEAATLGRLLGADLAAFRAAEGERLDALTLADELEALAHAPTLDRESLALLAARARARALGARFTGS